MLNGGRAHLLDAPHLTIFPGLAIALLASDVARSAVQRALAFVAGNDHFFLNISMAACKAMLDAARPYLLRILGPNCIGLLTPRLGLNATFAHTDVRAGDMRGHGTTASRRNGLGYPVGHVRRGRHK